MFHDVYMFMVTQFNVLHFSKYNIGYPSLVCVCMCIVCMFMTMHLHTHIYTKMLSQSDIIGIYIKKNYICFMMFICCSIQCKEYE